MATNSHPVLKAACLGVLATLAAWAAPASAADGGPALPVKLALRSQAPCNVFLPGEAAAVTLAVDKPAAEQADVTLTPRVRDAYGKDVATLKPVTLSKANGYAAALSGLPKEVGYYEVDCGKPVDATPISYAVMPATPMKEHDLGSPFGVCTHFQWGWDPIYGKAARRAGIAWIRDSGFNANKGKNDFMDLVGPVVKENKFCFLNVWDFLNSARPHAWWEKYRRPNDQWDFSDLAKDWFADSAKKYSSVIDAYDIMNEPNWGNEFGGSWDGGPWVPVYLEFWKQVSAAVRAADPGKPVLWEPVPDGLRQITAGSCTQYVDGYSPHPYNMDPSRPLPEENEFFTWLPAYRQFLKDNNLNWPIWVGEIGYSSFTADPKKPQMFYAPNTELEQAQTLARMVAMLLANGVEKVFWYDLKDDTWNNDPAEAYELQCHFGLLRKNATPKPSLLAYASASHYLYGAKWLGFCTHGTRSLHLYGFISARSGKPVMMGWLPNGVYSKDTYLSDTEGPVQATDIFGGKQTLKIQGEGARRRVSLPVNRTPIFIEGISLNDVERVLDPLPR